MGLTDDQLAMAIGRAVLDAIKAYEPTARVERVRVMYQSPRQLAEMFDKSPRTVSTLLSEIRGEIKRGRYPEDAILDGCGTVARVDVVTDYLRRRRMLKDPNGRKYVEPWEDVRYDG